MSKTFQHNAGNLDQGRPALLRLIQKGCVTKADVDHLRREVFADRAPTRIEIDDLFAIDAVAHPQDESWIDFFVETVTDHVVWDIRPTGVVDEKHARWLMAQVDAAQSASSFAVLVNILDQAHRVPRWFAAAVRARAVAGWPTLVTSFEAPPVLAAALH